MEAGRHAREQIRANRGWKAEPDDAGYPCADMTCDVDNTLGVAEHAARDLDNFEAEGSHDDVRAGPFDELNAKAVLKGPQLLAQGRLCDISSLRSPPEMSAVSHGNQIFQLSECRHGVFPLHTRMQGTAFSIKQA